MDSSSVLACVLVALTQLGPQEGAQTGTHQEFTDRATFDFDEKQASIWASVLAYEGDCEIHVLYKKENLDGVKVTFVRNGKEVLTFSGHSWTVFAAHEKVLYGARFWYNTDGCSVVASDLNNGKEFWSTRLTGLGGVWHSFYENKVNLRVEGNLLKILGRESAGEYLELLDRKTGKRVGHRVFRGPGISQPKRQGEDKNQ